MAPLRLISLRNLGDLDFDLSKSLKVKFNGAVGLPMHDLLLGSNCIYRSISHHVGVIATKIPLSLIIRANFWNFGKFWKSEGY